MDRLQRGINHLLEVAPLRRRNYIIDQVSDCKFCHFDIFCLFVDC